MDYSVVIVSHNSESCLPECLNALKQQTIQPLATIVIDSGSSSTDYLIDCQKKFAIELQLVKENIGFCKANNLALSYLPPQTQFVLFLNPDAFLTPNFAEQALNRMQDPNGEKIGALSGLLLGYSIKNQQPTNRIDSTGIFCTWYGRWFDRYQGQKLCAVSLKQEFVPALCGALMFCRLKALNTVEFSNHCVMDPLFFMYKEDIDLSLRLQKKGWSLLFDPSLIAYHTRGWKQNRRHVPRFSRLLSAKNEMRLNLRLKSPHFLYSFFKYLAVKCLNF